MKNKSPKKKETLILLDTHAIIHRAYHALPELTSPSGEPVGAVYGLAAMLIKIVNDLKPDHVIAAYDLPGPTHRHEVYAAYKGKRPEIDDALVVQINRSRDVLKAFGIPIYEAPGFEADDVIGTIAEKAKKKFNVIVASGDMDTLQLVDDARVRVYTLRKGIQDTVLYDEEAVIARFGFPPKLIPDYKGFAGDPSDNIIGVPGIGEKTATMLLTTFGSLEDVYRTLEKTPEKLSAAGIKDRVIGLLREHRDEAEFSKVLATIRTDAPLTFIEPHESFLDSLDRTACAAFFNELGFRSLAPRIKSWKLEAGSVKQDESNPQPSADSSYQGSEPLSPADAALLKEAAVMLWLTESETTNPSLDDVLFSTKADTISEAHARLLEKLRAEDLEEVFRTIEKPLIPVVDAMNARGVLIDRPYLTALSKEYRKELNALAQKIYAAAGEEFNINSPRQLGDILFTKLGVAVPGKKQKKTATGQASTKESELLKLKDAHPIIADILAYRELAKLLGTYIDAIPPLLGPDGRLRTTFIQTGAATGRFASRDPGLQNIPIKTELGRRIRNAFVAESGTLLLAFDYSQIELRLAAILSHDAKLEAIFKSGQDVHTAVAAEVFGVPQSDVTKEMRRRAKVINFGILYGMGVNALRENLGTDRAEAQAYLTRYFETFATLAEYLSQTKATAARLGYTKTLFGRKRYFPGMKSKLPFVRAQAERMAINAPLQGTQADIIKIAMVKIHTLIQKRFQGDAAIVLQIHDELIFEVDTKRVDEFATEVKNIMESVLPEHDIHTEVPITVSSEAGPTWGDMKPLN